MELPKGKEQRQMEERLQIIIKLFPELSTDEQKRIVDFIIFTYNS